MCKNAHMAGDTHNNTLELSARNMNVITRSLGELMIWTKKHAKTAKLESFFPSPSRKIYFYSHA